MVKENLEKAVSELRTAFDKLHKDIEYIGIEEIYPKASQIYRNIEQVEEILKEIDTTIIIKELNIISETLHDFVTSKQPCDKGTLNACIQGYLCSIKSKLKN